SDALPLVRRCLSLRRDVAHGLDASEAEGLGTLTSDAAELGVSLVAELRAAGALSDAQAAAEAFRFAAWRRALALAESLKETDGLSVRILSDDLREEDVRSRDAVTRARSRLDAALARSSSGPGGADGALKQVAEDRARLDAASVERERV